MRFATSETRSRAKPSRSIVSSADPDVLQRRHLGVADEQQLRRCGRAPRASAPSKSGAGVDHDRAVRRCAPPRASPRARPAPTTSASSGRCGAGSTARPVSGSDARRTRVSFSSVDRRPPTRRDRRSSRAAGRRSVERRIAELQVEVDEERLHDPSSAVGDGEVRREHRLAAAALRREHGDDLAASAVAAGGLRGLADREQQRSRPAAAGRARRLRRRRVRSRRSRSARRRRRG